MCLEPYPSYSPLSRGIIGADCPGAVAVAAPTSSMHTVDHASVPGCTCQHDRPVPVRDDAKQKPIAVGSQQTSSYHDSSGIRA